MVGQTDDQHVLIGAFCDLIEMDAWAVGNRNRRRPRGVGTTIRHQHRSSSVAQSIRVDLDVIAHAVDRFDRLTEPDVELVRADQVGQRHT